MKSIVIEVPEPGDESQCFDVVDELGQRCNGLTFDEMLGQVVNLTHPGLRRPHYRMQTAEEWESERQRRAAARSERSADIVDPNH